MNNLEILDKAFQKAYDNGWRLPMYGDQRPTVIEGADATPVIYNQGFAKALWGEVEYMPAHNYYPGMPTEYMEQLPSWQYHLQQMVISDNPIEYLGENI